MSKRSPPTSGWPLYEPRWAPLWVHPCCSCGDTGAHNLLCSLHQPHPFTRCAIPNSSCELTVLLQSSITLNKKKIALYNHNMQKVYFKMNFHVEHLQRVEKAQPMWTQGSHSEGNRFYTTDISWYLQSAAGLILRLQHLGSFYFVGWVLLIRSKSIKMIIRWMGICVHSGHFSSMHLNEKMKGNSWSDLPLSFSVKRKP